MTIVGLHDFVKVSISAEFKSFLLIMSIDAPESTTNSLSSGLRFDGASRHQFSESEKNAVLFSSFNFRMLSASLHAASRAHRSCLSVSSWDRSSNFGALGLRWWGITWANHSKRWILVSNVRMTNDGFCEVNTSDWFPCVWALPQNRCRLRRLHILKYATQLSCNFQHCHCTFVTILFRPFARLFFNLAMRIRALFSQICIHSPTCKTSILEDAICHRMNWCKFLWGDPCRAIETSFHWDFASGTSGSRCISLELGEGFGWVVFARLLISWRKLQSSPLEHCPLAFHCQHSPGVLCSRCCPLILDHGVCLIISVSGLKILHSQILLDTSFHHCLQSVIIRSYFLLMNLQVIHFQYGLEFLRLSYSEFVQTFQDAIKWDFRHWQ